MSFANFHIHTYFSDGNSSPSEVIEGIYSIKDLNYFAITDHDTLSGIEPVFRLKKRYESENLFQIKQLFPDINETNCTIELKRLDLILGDFCRYRCAKRGLFDLDARIRKAFLVNLDGIRDSYGSAEEIIALFRSRAQKINDVRFRESEKEKDIIQYPVPVTYQVIIDFWEEFVPSSSREKALLYTLRPDSFRVTQLAEIYISDGMPESEAKQMAEEKQGIMCKFERPLLKEIDILEGLDLLRRAGAVTILTHPAINHYMISYEEFDKHVTLPLIEEGLDGIEVFYPYDMAYREEAFLHYDAIAGKHGLLVSGGTDFHGDDRTRLDDVKLDEKEASVIINHKQKG
jgi:hypothetical protein